MRITAKGQVTIPQQIRESAGMMPGTDVEFEVDGATVRLVKSSRDARRKTRGKRAVEALRGRGDFGMSADEVIAMMRGPPADDL